MNGRDEGDAEVDALLAQLSAAALDPDNTAHANPLDVSELQRLQAEAQRDPVAFANRVAHQSDGDGLEVYDLAESYGSDPWAGLPPRSEYLNLWETKLEEHLHALQIMHREQSAPPGR